MSSLLNCSRVSKSYPGVLALRDVDFDLKSGEVHALAGENGAGKSTLMHILAGAARPDAGTISVGGEPVLVRDEHHAQQLGIAIVYQERSLFNQLSIAENLFPHRQPLTRAGLIDRRRMLDQSRDLLEEVHLAVDPVTLVCELSPAQQQMVEIARALSLASQILILDEPTAALTFSETETLFAIIAKLRASGKGIIYITHRLEEIFAIADRVTVLKDGVVQGSWQVADTTPERLVASMIGREPLAAQPEAAARRGSVPLLAVKKLHDSKLKDICFEAYAGEILGFAGLAGAGRSELMLTVFGARRVEQGEVLVGGRPMRIRAPEQAIAHGIGYVPEDRKSQGLFLSMDIAANTAAARLDSFGGRLIRSERVTASARAIISQLQITPNDPARIARTLSGGNQQKVLLGRWLLRDPAILIVDEPTRGVDAGARAEIYQILRSLAASGKAVIVVSSDLAELLAISDRILVMRSGRIVGEFTSAEATEERIMQRAAIASTEDRP